MEKIENFGIIDYFNYDENTDKKIFNQISAYANALNSTISSNKIKEIICLIKQELYKNLKSELKLKFLMDVKKIYGEFEEGELSVISKTHELTMEDISYVRELIKKRFTKYKFKKVYQAYDFLDNYYKSRNQVFNYNLASDGIESIEENKKRLLEMANNLYAESKLYDFDKISQKYIKIMNKKQ
ncbi:MAG: hypothetical protein KatS3mg096_628 [Candidatus Parcubacteria bacterium]|nr:MAG: hypothetical protein KatS3mg096_628 [Candidatus Parcubacteria bacterium]